MENFLWNFIRPLKQFKKIDWIAIILSLVGVNFIDIYEFFYEGVITPLKVKISITVIIILFLIFLIGNRLDLKEIYSFKDTSKAEAKFFSDWYSRNGDIHIYCTDLDWLKNGFYSTVVDSLKMKAVDKRLFLYLKIYNNRIVEELVRLGATLYCVKMDNRSDHRFSINIDEHIYSIIIRNKKYERDSITVEEYIDHRAFADLGLDMLDDCYFQTVTNENLLNQII